MKPSGASADIVFSNKPSSNLERCKKSIQEMIDSFPQNQAQSHLEFKDLINFYQARIFERLIALNNEGKDLNIKFEQNINQINFSINSQNLDDDELQRISELIVDSLNQEQSHDIKKIIKKKLFNLAFQQSVELALKDFFKFQPYQDIKIKFQDSPTQKFQLEFSDEALADDAQNQRINVESSSLKKSCNNDQLVKSKENQEKILNGFKKSNQTESSPSRVEAIPIDFGQLQKSPSSTSPNISIVELQYSSVAHDYRAQSTMKLYTPQIHIHNQQITSKQFAFRVENVDLQAKESSEAGDSNPFKYYQDQIKEALNKSIAQTKIKFENDQAEPKLPEDFFVAVMQIASFNQGIGNCEEKKIKQQLISLLNLADQPNQDQLLHQLYQASTFFSKTFQQQIKFFTGNENTSKTDTRMRLFRASTYDNIEQLFLRSRQETVSVSAMQNGANATGAQEEENKKIFSDKFFDNLLKLQEIGQAKKVSREIANAIANKFSGSIDNGPKYPNGAQWG